MLQSSQPYPSRQVPRGEANGRTPRINSAPRDLCAPVRPPVVPPFRAIYWRWLARLLVALGLVTALVLLVAYRPVPPLEATVRLERLAAQAERAGALPAKTAAAIERLIEQPAYDCNQTDCPPELEQRNRAVRGRLNALLSTRTRNEIRAADGK
jgi:hypothetical protein